MKKQEKFKAFLIKHKAYRKYVTNIKKEGHKSFESCCKIISMEDLVDAIFTWSETPEKLRYWANLNDLWRKELKRKP